MVANTSGNVQHSLAQGMSPGAGVMTFSVFVLSYGVAGGGDARYVTLQVNDGDVGVIQAVFDISQGAGALLGSEVETAGNLTGPAPVISPCGNFFRISLAFTKTGTYACTAYIIPSQSPTYTPYAGTSGVTSLFLWGPQFENVAAFPMYGPGATAVFPMMYLPTTTAVVTRSDASLGPTGILTLNAGLAATAGIPLLWSGQFYYRVRFDDDSLDFTQFMQNFWALKKLKLRQVRL
jgi:hypothetical protein